MWFSLFFSSPVECYSMDSWCWLWSRCPLWKTYSETHYRLCEWRMTNEVNLTADGCFFLAVSHPPPAAQRRRRFTRTTWSRCGATKRTRRGHAPPRLKPLLLISTLHPEWTTASWTHMRTHTHGQTTLFITALIYYCKWIKATVLLCVLYNIHFSQGTKKCFSGMCELLRGLKDARVNGEQTNHILVFQHELL